MKNQFTIYCISDTHQRHRELTEKLSSIVNGDILLHAGDFTNYGGTFRSQGGGIDDFNMWLGSLPFKHKLLIFGNHERVLIDDDDLERVKQQFSNATYLNDELVDIDGLKIYGASWKADDGRDRRQLWSKIPLGTQIVITHNPPDGKSHATSDASFDIDKFLMRRILQVKPILSIFGHIHTDYGVWEKDKVTFVNAANMNEEGKALNEPVGFRLEMNDDKLVKLQQL